jgi:hypothetical protein
VTAAVIGFIFLFTLTLCELCVDPWSQDVRTCRLNNAPCCLVEASRATATEAAGLFRVASEEEQFKMPVIVSS